MIDLLKKMAVQKLSEKWQANSLNAEATSSAAQEGAGALISKVQEAISGGNMEQVKDLFSNGGAATEQNGIFQFAQGKMAEILQGKGLSAEQASTEANNALPELINGLRSKFESKEAADSGFDLGAIASLAGGAGGILGKVKDLF